MNYPVQEQKLFYRYDDQDNWVRQVVDEDNQVRQKNQKDRILMNNSWRIISSRLHDKAFGFEAKVQFQTPHPRRQRTFDRS